MIRLTSFMRGSMSIDREKKIAEIREALEKATPGPWTKFENRIYGKARPAVEPIICEFYEEETEHDRNNAHLIANAPEWLGFLLSELDKRDERIRKLEVQLDDERNACYEALEMLNETRRLLSVVQKREQKLIKTLRFYSKGDNGQRAREVLKEMGVLLWEEFFTGGARERT